jgi:murein DD-endopeptidase MepM/ murein hydrolase activator NlpD
MPSLTETLVIKRQADQSLSSEILNHPLDAVPVFKSGMIESSLFEAAAVSGIPENIIMEMANIFGWDIDFALDIRKGDRFAVVYNELYKEGRKVRSGQILAAEFINRGKTYRALYYTDPKGNSGYFTPDGKSMRKAFLRSPVKFSRISSRFSGKRWHPVLGKWRSHRGVDYAAARGTPIRAAGDGKVIKATYSKSYGNVVFLQHGGRYTTVYAHMKGFARGIRKGKRVRQGQVIGYVGSTGLASGPHLHYEFRVNGVHRNPLTVKLPAAAPINPAYLEDFKRQTRNQLALLELAREQAVARLDDEAASTAAGSN